VNEGQFLLLPIPPSLEHKVFKEMAKQWHGQKVIAAKDLLGHPVQSLLPGTRVLRSALH